MGEGFGEPQDEALSDRVTKFLSLGHRPSRRPKPAELDPGMSSVSPSSSSGGGGRSPSAAATRLGATIIPVRTGPKGDLEVLCAQHTIVNYLKSAPGQPREIMPFPGEFRLLGALWKPEVDVTPLDTAVRGLTSCGWKNAQRYIRSYDAAREQLGRAALQAVLFAATGPGTSTQAANKTFHFLCSMEAAAADHFVQTLNHFLEVTQDYCDSKGEELFEIPEALRAPLCPVFRCVSWMSVGEILRLSDASREYVNDYQRREFLKYGVQGRRNEKNAHMAIIERLNEFCEEVAFEKAYRLERSLCVMAPAKLRASEYSELEVCVPGFDQLQILSLNLNILPFGATYWTGHATAGWNFLRLRRFLDIIQRELEEQAARHAEQGTADCNLVTGSSPVRRRSGLVGEAHALDIIAVQELFASPFVPGGCLQSYAIKEMAKLGYQAVTGFKPSFKDLALQGKWTDSGLVIFSRLPVASSRTLRFSAGASADAGACKGAIWARLELAEGRFLDVFNCHLQASHTRSSSSSVFDRIRKSQLGELKGFMQLAGSEHPFILTGDFNVDAIPEPLDPMGTYGFPFRPPRHESDDYRRMVRDLDGSGKLVDLLCGPTDDDPLGGAAKPSERRHPCTRPPLDTQPKTARYVAKHKYPQRLDYIFYRPTLTSLVEHSHTYVDQFKVTDCPKFEYLSDHFGIRTHFRLRCSLAWAKHRQEELPLKPQLPRIMSSCQQVEFCLSTGTAIAAILLGSFQSEPRWKATFKYLAAGATVVSCASASRRFLLKCCGHRSSKRQPSSVALSGGGDSAAGSMRTKSKPTTPPPTTTVASNPYDAFTGAVESYGARRCLASRAVQPDGTLGEFTWLTYRDVQDEVLRISSGLHRKFNLQRNARVGLLGDTCAEWLLCDLSLMRCGVDIVCLAAPAGSVCQAESTSKRTWDLELLICSVDWLEHFVESARNSRDKPTCPIVTFKPVPNRLLAQAQHEGFVVTDLEYTANFGEVAGWVPYVGVGGWEVQTTMYRSKTGKESQLAQVSVTLHSLASAANAMAQALELSSEDVHFSYSWPAFAAERTVLHAMLASGGAIGFFGGVRSPRIFEDIRGLGPTFLLGTPSLFRRQIVRLRYKHVGWLGKICFVTQRWALKQIGAPEWEGWVGQLLVGIAQRCLSGWFCNWLSTPLLHARDVLLGPKTRLRFVLALCTAGSSALPVQQCLWMRLLFGCPVLKGLVAVEAGGLCTLGEVAYFGESPAEAFTVGCPLPGVQIELLPMSIPLKEPLSILGSRAMGMEHGTMRIRRLVTGSEARIGIVCGRRDQELFVFGRLCSMEETRLGHPAVCEALEQLLVQLSGPWLVQLFLVARPVGGVVGIAVVRLEELFRLMRWRRLEVRAEGEAVCQDANVRALCLYELRKQAQRHGFHEAEFPRALHLETQPFSLEAGLQTPTFQLRRDQLLPRFSETIDKLLGELPEATESPAISEYAESPTFLETGSALTNLGYVKRAKETRTKGKEYMMRLASFPSEEWGH